MSCSSLRCRRRLSCCPRAPLGQPGRYGSGFLVQPVAVRRARALWLVARARRSAAKAVHCLRVASSAAANRDHRATTKPRTTRCRRPGRLQPSPYRLFGRTRGQIGRGCPKHTSLNALRGLRLQTRRSTRGSKRSCPRARRRHPTPSRSSSPRNHRREPQAQLLDHKESCPEQKTHDHHGRARVKYRREGPAPV